MMLLTIITSVLVLGAAGLDGNSPMAMVPARVVDRVITGKMKTVSAIYAREFMVAGKYADGSRASGAMLALFDSSSTPLPAASYELIGGRRITGSDYKRRNLFRTLARRMFTSDGTKLSTPSWISTAFTR